MNAGAADLETGSGKGSQEGFDRGRVGTLCTKRASWWYHSLCVHSDADGRSKVVGSQVRGREIGKIVGWCSDLRDTARHWRSRW